MTTSSSNEMNTTSPLEAVRRSRMKLLLIAGIVVIPILTAYTIMFFKPEWIPTGTTNNGTLVSPSVSITALPSAESLPAKWILMHPTPGTCDLTCQEMLYLSRQVHTALGKETSRVERYLVTREDISAEYAELLEAEHNVMGHLRLKPGELEGLLPDIKDLYQQQYVLLIDPNGNIMMYYSLEQSGKPMMRDLKHLLRISKIG